MASVSDTDFLYQYRDPQFDGKDKDLYANTIAFARIWRVYIHSQAADKFGPMPFPAYATVEDNPPYKSVKDIYYEYFTELDEALNSFSDSAEPIFSDAGIDLVYKNDVSLWKNLETPCVFVSLFVYLRWIEGNVSLRQMPL